MACEEAIGQNIISNCLNQISGGNEKKAWLLQRTSFAITYDVTNVSKITDIAAIGTGVQAFTLLTDKKAIDSGFDRVKTSGRSDSFTHTVTFPVYEHSTIAKENIDSLEDIIVIVESRDKGESDAVFRAYGVKTGLDVSSDTERANTDNGVRLIELGPAENDTEQWSYYNVDAGTPATTLALLEALETPSV